MYKLVKLVIILALYWSIVSCNGESDNVYDNSSNEINLSVETTWYWQLLVDDSHPLRTDIPAILYDIDLFDISAETIRFLKSNGKIIICYFSAGSYEEWRPDAQKFPPESIGKPLDNWEGERWLDIRNETVKQIMIDRLKLAKQKGCDGVEPDNVDGYINDTGFNITYEDQLIYNKFLAKEAHKLGLLIGLKNDLEQINELVDYFDFAINEQCFEFNECHKLLPFIYQGKPIFNAEYKDVYVYDENTFKDLCSEAKQLNIRTIVLPLNLDGSFVKSCDYGEY